MEITSVPMTQCGDDEVKQHVGSLGHVGIT